MRVIKCPSCGRIAQAFWVTNTQRPFCLDCAVKRGRPWTWNRHWIICYKVNGKHERKEVI